MIRRAQEKDIDRINALLQQVLMVHADGRPDIFIPGTTKYSNEELAEMMTDDNKPIFVSTDEDDFVLGYAFCIFEEIKNCNNMYDMKTLYIDDICVDEISRGKHVATGLYEYVKQYAKDNGCYRVTLNVWECNPGARKFYEKMGMVPLKTAMEMLV